MFPASGGTRSRLNIDAIILPGLVGDFFFKKFSLGSGRRVCSYVMCCPCSESLVHVQPADERRECDAGGEQPRSPVWRRRCRIGSHGELVLLRVGSLKTVVELLMYKFWHHHICQPTSYNANRSILTSANLHQLRSSTNKDMLRRPELPVWNSQLVKLRSPGMSLDIFKDKPKTFPLSGLSSRPW